MENLLKEILKELKEFKNQTNERLSKLDQGQQEIKDHLIQLDSQDADRHMDTFSKIKTIDKDVKFIKHKLHQTEEDVFDIKDHLKAIK
ncbi:hypothetical protein [Marinisporobacter balticus]|uniref:Uncharacterized protein n=1 Tax=Marinisporobacter balticus TaxID=2018667 RepID=A0A4R2L0S5_9FIRM|nr:hypothetical protein [Marinisporobacter balticus]TCO79152.1 hypothetical protein EV214_103204 [Marinisporobacter balticus]